MVEGYSIDIESELNKSRNHRESREDGEKEERKRCEEVMYGWEST